MPDVPAESTVDVIALLVAAAGSFVFFLKHSARKRAVEKAEPRRSAFSDQPQKGIW